MHNYLYTRLSLGLLLSFWAISVSTAASSSTSTSSLSLAPAQTRGRISKEIVRRQFYPKVKHGSEDAGGQYDVEMALGDSGGDGHYQEGFGRNPYRGSNLDEIEGVNRPPDPVTPTLLPILPLLNVTEPQDFTTSMILPNGNEVHIEQHVDIVYNQDNVQDKAPDNPRLEEIAAPHLISASISKAIPSSSQGKACRKPDTVTVTRTKQIQAVRTSTAREIVTVTQVRSRTRTKTRTAPGAGPPPGQPTTRPDAPPIPAPAPLPPSLPVPNPPKQETPKPKPRPKTKRPPKEQPTPEPRPQQPVQTKEVQNKNKAPAGYHAEMVKQHNKFRAEYGANPVGHNQEFVLKGEQWLRSCKMEHPPGLASNLYASGGSSPDLLAHADKAVNAWVNGPGEVEAYDPDNPQASHFTQVVWKSAKEIGCATVQCNLDIFEPQFWPSTVGWLHAPIYEKALKPFAFAADYLPFTPQIYDAGNLIGSFAENVQV